MNNSFDEIQSDAVDFEAREAHKADIRQDTKWLMGGIVWRY